jgi:uncharacterized repeat protein (TIGR01451 family)
LANVTVTDDQGVTPVFQSGDTNGNSLLEPGETWVYTATGTAQFGQYANIGEVTGQPVYAQGAQCQVPGLDPPTADDPSHYNGTATPGIDLEKATNGEDADTPTGPSIPVGDPVTWTYVVTNTGNVALSNVAVSDDVLGAITCPQDTLAVDESITCTATGTATAGQYANTGTVTSTAPDGSTPGDTDPSHYFGEDPAIDLEKATNGEDADTPTGPIVPVGSTVEFTYQVTNTGDVDLTNVTVTDDQLPDAEIDCGDGSNVIASLAAGESASCFASITATAGPYTNIGQACGVDPQENEVCDTDPSNHFAGFAGSPAPIPGISGRGLAVLTALLAILGALRMRRAGS